MANRGCCGEGECEQGKANRTGGHGMLPDHLAGLAAHFAHVLQGIAACFNDSPARRGRTARQGPAGGLKALAGRLDCIRDIAAGAAFVAGMGSGDDAPGNQAEQSRAGEGGGYRMVAG